MTKYNVLQLIYKLDPGGAEKVVCSLAKGLDRERFNPAVASFKHGAMVKDLSKQGIPFYVLGKSGKFDPSFLFRLLRLLREHKIHILHTHTFSPNFWGRIAAKIASIPFVISTEHTIASHKSALQRTIDKLLSPLSNKLVAVSYEVKQSNISLGRIAPSKITVIHNGIEEASTGVLEPTEISTYKKSLGLRNDLPVILTVGRLAPPKGHSFLLDALRLVNQEGCKAQFVFVGDGPLRDQLKAKAKDLGIAEHVVFAGFRTDVNGFLQIADVIAFPSVREGFSIAILEAMAAGKAIIATDVGGNREAIQSGVSGILVPPRDVNALTKAILNLIKNKDLATQLGKRAKERFLSEFTRSKMIKKTERLYNELITEAEKGCL
jgi:glycosyltransferase involved in cell wall biosynthesis